MTESLPRLRSRAALATVRSVLGALILVALLGTVAALVSYRADVAEGHRQVRERITRQGRLYADSLSLHFEVLSSELQRLADRGMVDLGARDAAVLAGIRDDRALFNEGVALFDLSGTLLWAEPPSLVVGTEVHSQPWFQAVLANERATVDALVADASSRLGIALPVKEQGTLAGVLLGVVRGSDRLLYGTAAPGELMLLVSSRGRVVVPLAEPSWAQAPDFGTRLRSLRSEASGGDTTWVLDGEEVMAESFPVRDTGLVVLGLQTKDTSVAPIRRRLNAQLAFLVLVQFVALGAFVLFLRRTWRVFLEAEERFAEQQKMAALGTAASLIAHEVKNSLNGLKAATSLLESGGNTQLVTRTVVGQVDRLGHLARSLLSFSGPSEPRRVPVQLDALAAEAVAALDTLPERPEAEVRTELAPVSFESDPLLLTTAIDNLARNAIEAAVAAKDLGRTARPEVTVRVLEEAREVVVQVDDNAGEAPAELDARLGDPFFTTKPRGIGLGLTMTTRAVETLGGTLRFTRLASGSRFEVRLPKTRGASE